uniref:Uncharacterized protein n=1 Tax=Anguilla anguilla TaxID=7936 RepID=A0A0E9VM47_ANGAN
MKNLHVHAGLSASGDLVVPVTNHCMCVY